MNDSGLDAGYVEKKRAKFLWEEVVRFIFLNAPFYCLVRQVDDVSFSFSFAEDQIDFFNNLSENISCIHTFH